MAKVSVSKVLDFKKIEDAVKALQNWENERVTPEQLQENLLKALKGLSPNQKIVVGKFVVFKGYDGNRNYRALYYSKKQTNIDWAASDARFKQLEKMLK